ncbi:ComEA family DNA-binding protein [Agaribacterium sp. ZY112]|uniref:ComEA family DNA-binding protein n=1 Tax=Agaribacterium sp. ZY112 TaxID=3233574 RepID=UPI0035258916
MTSKSFFTRFCLLFILASASITAPLCVHAGKDASAAIVKGKVNINVASAQILADMLDGVGMSKAQAIVDYRSKHGQFKRIEQLAEVKGIGPATIEKNKAKLTL